MRKEREKIGIGQNKYRKRKRDEMRKQEKKFYHRGLISSFAYQRASSVYKYAGLLHSINTTGYGFNFGWICGVFEEKLRYFASSFFNFN